MASLSSSIPATNWANEFFTSYTPQKGIGKSHFSRQMSLTTVSSMNKTWVRTPGYRDLVRTGALLPDNSFTYSQVKLDQGSKWAIFPRVVYGDGRSWSQVSVEYTPALAVGTSSPVRTITYAELNAKAISKAMGAQWNVPVFLAEAGKTARMVYECAERLARLAAALRRGDLPGFLRECKIPPSIRRQRAFLQDYGKYGAKVAGNFWLEWRYGWTPFMKDVEDAMNALMDTIGRPTNLEHTVRGSILRSKTVDAPNTAWFRDNTRSLDVRATMTTLTVERGRVCWRLRANAADLPARFGLLDPLSVAWELVPFSFVVDWFLPIGNYLETLSAPMRFNHLGGTYGYKIETFLYVTKAVDVGTYKAQLVGFDNCVGRSLSVSREKIVTSPMNNLPALEFKMPEWTNGRIASSLALLDQQVRRFTRK